MRLPGTPAQETELLLLLEHQAPVGDASSGQRVPEDVHPLGLPAGPVPEDGKAPSWRAGRPPSPELCPLPSSTGGFPPWLTRFPRAPTPQQADRQRGVCRQTARVFRTWRLGLKRLGSGWSPVAFSTRWKVILSSHSCSLLPSSPPASANICNVVLMRYGELEEGIDVLDGDGNLVGSSKIAARHVGCPGARGARASGVAGAAAGRLFVSFKCFYSSGAGCSP